MMTASELRDLDWKFITIVALLAVQWGTIWAKLDAFDEHIDQPGLHYDLKDGIRQGEILPSCDALRRECNFGLRSNGGKKLDAS